jgi:hypothetical protein
VFAGDKLDIKEGPSGLFIPGLRVEPVCSPQDVVSVLQKGKQHRSTFATYMNEHSSRRQEGRRLPSCAAFDVGRAWDARARARVCVCVFAPLCCWLTRPPRVHTHSIATRAATWC